MKLRPWTEWLTWWVDGRRPCPHHGATCDWNLYPELRHRPPEREDGEWWGLCNLGCRAR